MNLTELVSPEELRKEFQRPAVEEEAKELRKLEGAMEVMPYYEALKDIQFTVFSLPSIMATLQCLQCILKKKVTN